MTVWNEFLADEKCRKKAPEPEVYKLVTSLENLFSERPLRLWDLCCGAGRHTVMIARCGHEVYASDIAPKAVSLTQQWLDELNLRGEVELADMTVCPWPGLALHGVVSWDSLHHNNRDNIHRAMDGVHRRLLSGGLFMGTFKSTKADSHGMGKEIEPDTFVHNSGPERGIPHHFFDEGGIRALFKEWELLSLAEQVITYIERGDDFLEFNPFPYTTWGVLARKES